MQVRRVNEDGTAVDAGTRESTKVGLPRPLPTRSPARLQRSSPIFGGLSPPVSPQPTLASPVYPMRLHEESGQGGFFPGWERFLKTSVQSTPSMPLAPEHLNIALFRRANGKSV